MKLIQFDVSQNSVTQNDLLAGILFGGDCIGYEKIAVGSAAPVGLDLLTLGKGLGARKALVVIEADASSTNLDRVVRFREDGTNPNATDGLPIPDNGKLEVSDLNLANFKMIGIEGGKNHTAQVLYYA